MRHHHHFSLLPIIALSLIAVTFTVAQNAAAEGSPQGQAQTEDQQGPQHPHQPGPLLTTMLDGPLAEVDDIVFAARVSCNDHWYVNFGYYVDQPDRKGYREGGRLCRLQLRTGKVQTLLDDPQGGVRDPQVSYDGKKILFSYRKGTSANYHLYEIDIDGSHLTQLTDGPFDDIEPTYLPDGGIIFGSSRCRRIVNCWISRVTTLHRCEADGSDIRLLSSNNDHDNTPWVLEDGRVLYMRWEYVDRSQVDFHHLWTMNPDGTNQMVYYGNQKAGIAMLDAKSIPGTNKVVASFSPGHGMPEHMGNVALVDPSAGPDVTSTVKKISQGGQLYRDPIAITENCFFVANRQGIFVMDGDGNNELIYQLPPGDAPLECHEPRPLLARARERAIPPRVNLAKKTGQVVLADIYNGRSMDGVERGEIKKLLVLEQLPKQVNFSGGQDPLSIGGTFALARILGTVPVEEDGSARVDLPAARSIFFVALDKDNLSVRRMQSFVTVQPGETTGCVGCHEQRTKTPHFQQSLLALERPASQIEPIADVPDVIDYPRDVQPILDQHCVACHDADRREGGVELTGDHTPAFSVSYWTMIQRGLIADGRNKTYSQQVPRSIGSSASKLMKFIDGSHHDVSLTPREHKMIRLWIETSATYAGTYAALGSGVYPVDLPVLTMQRRCAECHTVNKIERSHVHYRNFSVHFGPKEHKERHVPDYLRHAPWQYPLVTQARCNLTRPDHSLLLRAPLAKSAGGLELCKQAIFSDTSDPDYQEILATIRSAGHQLQQHKRFDMPGFRPNEHYIREMKQYGMLPADLREDDPIDVYRTDQAYWKSFWYQPEGDK